MNRFMSLQTLLTIVVVVLIAAVAYLAGGGGVVVETSGHTTQLVTQTGNLTVQTTQAPSASLNQIFGSASITGPKIWVGLVFIFLIALVIFGAIFIMQWRNLTAKYEAEEENIAITPKIVWNAICHDFRKMWKDWNTPRTEQAPVKKKKVKKTTPPPQPEPQNADTGEKKLSRRQYLQQQSQAYHEGKADVGWLADLYPKNEETQQPSDDNLTDVVEAPVEATTETEVIQPDEVTAPVNEDATEVETKVETPVSSIVDEGDMVEDDLSEVVEDDESHGQNGNARKEQQAELSFVESMEALEAKVEADAQQAAHSNERANTSNEVNSAIPGMDNTWDALTGGAAL